MMLLIVPWPCESSTFSDTSDASGAMPAFSPFESRPLPRDDPGDVGAVAVVVIRQRAAVDEVDELANALIPVGEQLGRGVGQVVVPRA